MYDLDANDDFDREMIATYEEVAKLYPRPGVYRPMVLIGAPGVGRNELRRRLIARDPERYRSPVPCTMIYVFFFPCNLLYFNLLCTTQIPLEPSDTERLPAENTCSLHARKWRRTLRLDASSRVANTKDISMGRRRKVSSLSSTPDVFASFRRTTKASRHCGRLSWNRTLFTLSRRRSISWNCRERRLELDRRSTRPIPGDSR